MSKRTNFARPAKLTVPVNRESIAHIGLTRLSPRLSGIAYTLENGAARNLSSAAVAARKSFSDEDAYLASMP